METIFWLFAILFILIGIPGGIAAAIIFLIKSKEKNRIPYQPGYQDMAAQQPVPVQENEETVQQSPVQEQAPQQPFVQQQAPQYQQWQPQIPEKLNKKLSASAVMLLIGTIFIILSAITFVAANWVKMEPAGRVFALSGAAVLAYAVCGVMKSAVKLDRTSAAFYIIGTLVSVTAFGTAGYYELFGSWFSIQGDGNGLLMATMMLISSAASFAAYPIYKKEAFRYIGTSFISAAILFICVQFTIGYEEFAAAIAAVQLILTAVIHLVKPHTGTVLEKPIALVGDVTAIIYAFLAMVYVAATSFSTTGYTFAILGMIMAQFVIYGIFKKQKWMFIFLDLFALYTDLIASYSIGQETDSSTGMLVFAVTALVIYILNNILPNDLAITKLIAFVGLISGAFVSLGVDGSEYAALAMIVPAAAAAAMMAYGLSKDKGIQQLAGIAMPLMPLAMMIYLKANLADILSYEHRGEISMLITGAFILVCIGMAAFYLFLPKFFFGLHAHHPLQTHTPIYSTMIASAVALLTISGNTELSAVVFGLCVLHFAVSCAMRCNFTAASPVISAIILTYSILENTLDAGSENIELAVMFGLFIVLVIVSRIVFPEAVVLKKDGKTMIDVLLLGAWTAILPFPFDTKMANFLRFIAIAVYIAAFIKRRTSKDTAAVMLSFSAFFMAAAAMARPFLIPESSMISSKVTLAIMVLLGVAYKYIWRNHKETSKFISTLVFVLAFIGLNIDGLVYSDVLNKIFVLCVTAGILILSFFVKSKTWFSVSSTALLLITVVNTYKYFDAAGWWIYLLAVGVIFIGIAAVNEACKKKGETVRSTVAKKFSDWTW